MQRECGTTKSGVEWSERLQFHPARCQNGSTTFGTHRPLRNVPENASVMVTHQQGKGTKHELYVWPSSLKSSSLFTLTVGMANRRSGIENWCFWRFARERDHLRTDKSICIVRFLSFLSVYFSFLWIEMAQLTTPTLAACCDGFIALIVSNGQEKEKEEGTEAGRTWPRSCKASACPTSMQIVACSTLHHLGSNAKRSYSVCVTVEGLCTDDVSPFV
jgi:hypothetical protein